MQLLDHAAPHQMGRQLPQGPHGEREPKVVRPRARDLQHHTDVFRPILRRSARRLARAQRLEPASVEQPNQLPHILLAEMQPLGNIARAHPLSGEGDDLRPPQVRGGLRRLQDLCQAPTFSCREFSNIQTHVALLWLLRLSVLDTKWN